MVVRSHEQLVHGVQPCHRLFRFQRFLFFLRRNNSSDADQSPLAFRTEAVRVDVHAALPTNGPVPSVHLAAGLKKCLRVKILSYKSFEIPLKWQYLKNDPINKYLIKRLKSN